MAGWGAGSPRPFRRDAGPEPIVLLERSLDACGNPDGRHWFDYQLDLSKCSGAVGKRAFETLPGDKGAVWYDWSSFSDPTIRETIECIDLSGASLSASIGLRGGRHKIAVLAKGAHAQSHNVDYSAGAADLTSRMPEASHAQLRPQFFRNADLHVSGRSNQEPPRLTLRSPVSEPVGSVFGLRA